jgi:hypothetical protein
MLFKEIIAIYSENHKTPYVQNTALQIVMSGLGAQGDPCTATIFCPIVCPHLLYSASSPLSLTKFSILRNWILS